MRLTIKRLIFWINFIAVSLMLLNYFLSAETNRSYQYHSVLKLCNQTPTHSNDFTLNKVWPEENPYSDRILEQLEYEPTVWKNVTVLVYLANTKAAFSIGHNDNPFAECKVNNCNFTDNNIQANVVIFLDFHIKRPEIRPSGQIWIAHLLSSPLNTPFNVNSDLQINYSATYRYDSDLVVPYEKLQYNKNVKKIYKLFDYVSGKTKQVAWFVSNCKSHNNRAEYANELNKYITVDVYGSCGNLKCHRKNVSCSLMLKKYYKFYLAFENSNCQDYITEKFFTIGLQNDILPVVMGAAKVEYERVAPEHSFIHVDDFESAKSLAEYLHYLDKNHTAYNEYFRWKHTHNYEFIKTKFWCRLCTMMNNPKQKIYKNFEQWWKGPSVCRGNKTVLSS